MTINVNLPEAPAIKVTKGGIQLVVREISAVSLIKVQEACTAMELKGFEDALEELFGVEGAKAAKPVLTFRDIGAIVNAIVERDMSPLAESSERSKAESLPSESAS